MSSADSKRIYCIYCSNVFLLKDSRSTELCSKHPSGFKTGPHNCREFLSIADRIKVKLQQEQEEKEAEQ